MGFKADLYEIMDVVLTSILSRLINEKSDNDSDDFEEEISFDEFYDMDEETEKDKCEEDDWKYKMLQFLTSENENDDVFDTIKNNFGYTFAEDKTMYKRIMMLIIASRTYCGIMYDTNRQIASIDEEVLSFYARPLHYQDIIDFFENAMLNDENLAFAMKLLDYFLDYALSDDNYLYIAHVLGFIKNSGRFSKLLKMNPFEVLHFMGSWPLDELVETESIIQTLRDCYDYVLGYSIQEEVDNETRMHLFLDKLADYCHYDKGTIDNVIKYVFSNVYENCCLDLEDEEWKGLADLIEGEITDIDKFVETFKTDTDLFWTIMDKFHYFNVYLDPDDLWAMRGKFLAEKEDAKIKVLQKLNPFYEQEQEHFAQDYD